MKTTLKQLAAGTFLTILLMVGNLNAKATELKSSTATTIETTLDVENWMIDETVWDIKSFVNYEIVGETETALELEYWMTCEETWNLEDNFVDETETELIVEDWMISKSIWNIE